MQTKTGAQVWALRKVLLENADDTLNQLAAAGYTFIEPAGFDIEKQTIQGIPSIHLKQLANDQGLEMVSGHCYFNLSNAEDACQLVSDTGIQYIVHSFLKDQIQHTTDAYKKAANELNSMGAVAKKYGLQLAYHNHAHEFEKIGDEVPFDILLTNTDPDLVAFQPDLGWIVYAGTNPVTYFEKYPTRFPLWHLRDIDKTKQSTTIGNGVVDFNSIFAEREKSGLQYAIVEMASGTEDILHKMIESYNVIENGFDMV